MFHSQKEHRNALFLQKKLQEKKINQKVLSKKVGQIKNTLKQKAYYLYKWHSDNKADYESKEVVN